MHTLNQSPTRTYIHTQTHTLTQRHKHSGTQTHTQARRQTHTHTHTGALIQAHTCSHRNKSTCLYPRYSHTYRSDHSPGCDLTAEPTQCILITGTRSLWVPLTSPPVRGLRTPRPPSQQRYWAVSNPPTYMVAKPCHLASGGSGEDVRAVTWLQIGCTEGWGGQVSPEMRH